MESTITKLLIHGDEVEYHLFELAFYCASTGRHVWFFSPQAFNNLPKGLDVPEAAVLKLIRFFYFQDFFELLKHLTVSHSWMQTPAYLICQLIDTVNFCSRKSSLHCYLMLGCMNIENKRIMQRIIDLYIDKVIETDEIYEMQGVFDFD